MNRKGQQTVHASKRDRLVLALPTAEASLLHHQLRTTVDDAQAQARRVEQLPGSIPRVFERGVIKIPRIAPGVVMINELEEFIAVMLRVIYDDLPAVDPSYNAIMGAYIAILGSFCDVSLMVNSGVVREFAEINVDIVWTDWTSELIHRRYEEIKDGLFQRMGIQEGSMGKKPFIVFGFVMLLIMAKNVNEKNNTKWHQARWRAMAGTLSIEVPDLAIEPASVRNLSSLNNALASRHGVRSSLFKVIRQSSTMKTPYVAGFKGLMTILQWAEMTHIRQITKFIYRTHPEILSFLEFGNAEVSLMQDAFAYLASLPKEDQVYARLLYTPTETYPLHSSHFTTWTSCAYAIAEHEQTSMLNIERKETPFFKDLKAKVKAFLELKYNYSQLSAAETLATQLQPKTREEIVRAALLDCGSYRMGDDGDDEPAIEK